MQKMDAMGTKSSAAYYCQPSARVNMLRPRVLSQDKYGDNLEKVMCDVHHS